MSLCQRFLLNQFRLSIAIKSKSPRTFTNNAPDYIFSCGYPNISNFLPQHMLEKCSKLHISSIENTKLYQESLQYELNEGPVLCRSQIADWMNYEYLKNRRITENNAVLGDLPESDKVFGDKLFLCSGSSHGMKLCSHLLMSVTGSKIFLVEDPSYFQYGRILSTIHAQIVPIKTHFDKGIDFEYLESILQYFADENIAIAGMYTVITHNNPLGINYSMQQRRRLIEIAHKFKLRIIADETYTLLSFPNVPTYPMLSSIEKAMIDDKTLIVSDSEKSDVSDNFLVFSVSSLSKMIGPGFRMGWIFSHNERELAMITDYGEFHSGGNCIQFTSHLLRYLMLKNANEQESDLSLHATHVRQSLEARCELLCKTLRDNDKWQLCNFIQPKGGFFLWLQLPMIGDIMNSVHLLKQNIVWDKSLNNENINIAQLLKIKTDVQYFDGSRDSFIFGPNAKDIQYIFEKELNVVFEENDKKPMDHCIRVCFAFLDMDVIEKGAQLLMKDLYQVIENLVEQYSGHYKQYNE